MIKKRDYFRVLHGGGGGDGGSGEAQKQLAGISQEQWDWYKQNYLPEATTDRNYANQAAINTQQYYEGQYIPQAQQIEQNLTQQSGVSQGVNNGIATQQTGVSNTAANAATGLYDESGKQYAQSDFLNTQYNQHFLGDLSGVEAQANYTGSAADQAFQASLARGDVDQQFANQNANLTAKMEQAGIGGNSGQMLAVQAQSQTQQAAAAAAAMTQARNNAVQLGFTQKSQAAQLASGLSGAAQGAASAGASSAAAGSAASNASTSAAGQASSATNSATSNAQAPMSGLNTVAAGYQGAQTAATSPLNNELSLSSGLNGGASSSTQAATGAANAAAAAQQANAQESAANSQAIGSGIGAAAGIAALALMS